MRKPYETLYFFRITNVAGFKSAMKSSVVSKITSAATMIDVPANQPLAFINVAFSQSGLTTLSVPDNLGDAQFQAGQFADASALGDDTSAWESVFKGTSIHGVFLIGSDSQSNIDNLANTLWGDLGTSVSLDYSLNGAARPGSQKGHERMSRKTSSHLRADQVVTDFGFLDGISNPAITGFAPTVLPGQSIIPSGIILTGRLGDTTLRPSWTLDGSFLVFRKLKQLVPEFNKYLLDHPVQNAAGTLSVEQGAELLGARMIGRWKSGAPIDVSPAVDDAVSKHPRSWWILANLASV
jgi:Dyp-type peroxidase family